MDLIMRSYTNEDDFWRLRAFLREVFLLNDRHELSWPVIRLDYWRWHGIMNLADGILERDVFIWETQHEQIVAAVNGKCRACIPAYPPSFKQGAGRVDDITSRVSLENREPQGGEALRCGAIRTLQRQDY
jgi:hypothetical protein